MILREWKANIVSAVFLIGCAAVFVRFLELHEARIARGGWRFADPAFDLLPAIDVSLFIFTLTYGSIVVYLLMFYKRSRFPAQLMIAYGLLVLFRIVSMSLVPLQEPDSLIFLDDPFLNNLIYPGIIETDLFFSGHTALILAMFFISGRKTLFLLLAIVLGVLLMVQRVHYSIDIIGAVPFAYLASRMSGVFVEKVSFSNKT